MSAVADFQFHQTLPGFRLGERERERQRGIERERGRGRERERKVRQKEKGVREMQGSRDEDNVIRKIFKCVRCRVKHRNAQKYHSTKNDSAFSMQIRT